MTINVFGKKNIARYDTVQMIMKVNEFDKTLLLMTLFTGRLRCI